VAAADHDAQMNDARATAVSLIGSVSQAPPGVIGFDTTERLNPVTARQYFTKGYRYCIRYVSHDESVNSPYEDLSLDEGQIILDAGMALMAVQHPLKAGWTPTGDLGQTFGANAAAYAGNAGLLPGVNVFLDLEGVKDGTPQSDVIDFCNAWFAEVGLRVRTLHRRESGSDSRATLLGPEDKALLEGRIERCCRCSRRYSASGISAYPTHS
jgi:hypothetical protein